MGHEASDVAPFLYVSERDILCRVWNWNELVILKIGWVSLQRENLPPKTLPPYMASSKIEHEHSMTTGANYAPVITRP
jgi:hypothetical protein